MIFPKGWHNVKWNAMQYVFIDPFVGDCNERHVNSYGEMSCMENGAFIQAHALLK